MYIVKVILENIIDFLMLHAFSKICKKKNLFKLKEKIKMCKKKSIYIAKFICVNEN